MNLQNHIAEQLDRFVSDGVDDKSPALLTVDADHGRLTSELIAIGKIGCAFTHLTLATDTLAGAEVDDLKRLGERISQRLNYLMEPIAALELDAEGFTLQMRSQPPQRDEDGYSYYEVAVRRGGQIRLSRYRKPPGQPRATIPAEVTREVFARLAADLDAVVVE